MGQARVSLGYGADVTFLPYRDVKVLGVNLSVVEVRDDVGGIGGYGVPHFRHETELRIVSAAGAKVFGGAVNIFLDPHATDVPLLGRDVLDHFVVLFDRTRNEILLLDPPDGYQVIRS